MRAWDSTTTSRRRKPKPRDVGMATTTTKVEQRELVPEQQMVMLEQSVMQSETVQAMKVARDAQARQLQAIGGAAGVEDQMDAVRETMEDQQEINDVLAMGFGDGVDVEDDAELLDELAGIEEDMLDEQLADLGPVPVGGVSVAAPAAAAPAAASTDDAEMQALQAMMMPA